MRRLISDICLFVLLPIWLLVGASQAQFNNFPPGTFNSRAALNPAGGGGGGTLTYTATAVATAWQTSVSPPATFTAVAIGTASSDRIVVVSITVDGNASNGVISGVTIGGSGAAKAVGIDPTVAGQGVYIYSLLVTSGTTANIVISCSGFPSGIGISVGNIKGSATATVNATNSVGPSTVADPHSLTTVVPANGVGVVAAIIDRAITPSWTNATGDANISEVSAGAMSLQQAHTTNNTPSFTGANNFQLAMVAATWGP